MTGTFREKKARSPREYLDAAFAAEEYVRTFLSENEDGIFFGEEKDMHDLALYGGAAGILHMYCQLEHLTKDGRYREMIEKITTYLNRHCLDYADGRGERFEGVTKSFYSGIAGVGLILLEVSVLYGNKEAETGYRKVLNYYRDIFCTGEGKACWTDNPQIYFDGGVILFLVAVCENIRGEQGNDTLIEWAYEAAINATDYIIREGTVKDDRLEITRVQLSFKKGEPNFEFGTAGCGYLFAKVYGLTKNEKYLRAAEMSARYIESIAVRQQKGFLVPYKPDNYKDLYYLGNCHGPIGTAKLFFELYRITGEQKYRDTVENLYRGARSLGAPFARSKGFWNTMCICCGPPGYIPFRLR